MYLGLEHIEPGGRLLDPHLITAGDVASAKFAFEPGDILYGKLRPYLAKIAIPDFSGVCSTDIIPVRVTDVMDARFLLHYLRQPRLVDWANSRSAGANLPRLSPKVLAALPVPVPPLVEQRRIAAILDLADALRAKRREALARLDELTQSIFIDMFGDYLNGRRNCVVRPLSEVVRSGTIVTYGIVQAGDEYPGGVPYIRTGDIVNGEIVKDALRRTDPSIAAKYERSTVRRGDIVMSIRATVGTTAMVDDELDGANLTQGTARIAPGDVVDGTYLLEFLRNAKTQHWISRQVKGATFREITLSRLRQLSVVLPPLDLQREYANHLVKLAAVKSQHRTAIVESDALFASLQSRAFRGEL
ncbi:MULTISPECIES: restriction endonuclease subunit S [Nocardia]|uniref:restriction endonuclease subunit S n=1 Tax=Nocardia TaxID=1817 RepID=UPI000BF1F9F0|nr:MULTISPECIES: restriction endonuclease subunit S [Nocardia]MBF6184206.1 restriction endonuclease subunit S [Nocardia farcinica]MBF6290687.1 restriction endonuclease subunit S [Nocardia farcinica]MBF6310049.1 restriction endonuclease subunit S [Nocardia farcinica]MBF6377860.1 restriction endonuclease subunit S [Nocardia farcinica]MBF6406129.1 restriction endonuclease subunit S [Nocardia farcinica]